VIQIKIDKINVIFMFSNCTLYSFVHRLFHSIRKLVYLHQLSIKLPFISNRFLWVNKKSKLLQLIKLKYTGKIITISTLLHKFISSFY